MIFVTYETAGGKQFFNLARKACRADHGPEEIGMAKLDARQKRDALGEQSTHQGGRDLTEQELQKVLGGEGPPGTAGDGNGRGFAAGKLI